MSKKKAAIENQPINLFTIGFTQKTAEFFFETLIASGVK